MIDREIDREVDREKLIKALECIKTPTPGDWMQCAECPYSVNIDDSGWYRCGADKALADAIELLKAPFTSSGDRVGKLGKDSGEAYRIMTREKIER